MGEFTITKVLLLLAICWGETSRSARAEMKVGSVVLVNPDKEKVIEMQRGHGGWNSDMVKALGKIGKVSYIDTDHDMRVKICGDSWLYNREALTEIADGLLEISTEECVSGPTLLVTKRRVRRIGRMVDLDCTINLNPYRSAYVRWVKGGSVLSRNASVEVTDPRISVVFDFSNTFTLQIDDIRLDDAGTYACEVQTNNGSLLAAATVELVVQGPPTISDNSTRFLLATEGEFARLECYADGRPEPSITWHRIFKESISPLEDLIYRGNVLEMVTVRAADGGDYYCIADNGAGRSARRDVHLEVLKPGEVYTGRPPVEEKTATDASADSISQVLAEQMQLYAEKISNSTGEISLQADGLTARLKVLEKGLLFPEPCKESAVQTNRV